ncbi:MAG: hypothetical protein EXS47_01220 [Candidatus Zambryskibacteria bacterium]|nr:hypothetical protein [Candidatus Zambryskibacteria bacterium]
MSNKIYLRTVSFVFLVIAVLHLFRVVGGWEAVINGYTIPMWISWVVVLFAGFLVYRGYKMSKQN